MAHVIPAIRMIPRALYTPKIAVRTSDSKTTTSDTGTDFKTVLKNQATPAPADPADVVRTIGTVTPRSTTPVVMNPTVTEPAMAPSAQTLFGPNPWMTDAGGTGPNGSYSYNKYYFASAETAAKVAQMVGGKVVTTMEFTPVGGPFRQNQPNQMVQLPDGRLINPGIIASYYDRGWTQQSVDRLVNCEIATIAT